MKYFTAIFILLFSCSIVNAKELNLKVDPEDNCCYGSILPFRGYSRVKMDNALKISPDQISNHFTIDYDTEYNLRYEIYSIDGDLQRIGNVVADKKNRLDLNSGYYLIKIFNIEDKVSIARKLIRVK